MQGLRRRLKDESGIAAAVVAVVVVALIGAAMFTIDNGNVLATRRNIITGTDASALDAAQLFNNGAQNPCDVAGVTAAETHATNVLLQNHSGALHNPTDTPNGFEVTLADPIKCNTGGYTPGKVRFDGRLTAQAFFSKFFGFGDTKPFSSSTAAWGYITAIGKGLRPFYVCDQSDGYKAYVQYWTAIHDADPSNDAAAEDAYDSLWGSDQGIPGDEDPADPQIPNDVATYGKFPRRSMGYPSGEADKPAAKANPNYGLAYGNPAADNRFHPVIRVISPDPASPCGYAEGGNNGNRGFVDLRGADLNGSPGADALGSWIESGYPGEVALTPHDCNLSNPNDFEDCGAAPGDKNTLMDSLAKITCPVATPALQCDYIFPILVVNCVGKLVNGVCTHLPGTGGENAHYTQVAFLFVVLRGFGKIDSNTATLGFDYEFVDVQTSGEVGAAPPTNAQTYQTGIQLCGADHVSDTHCPF